MLLSAISVAALAACHSAVQIPSVAQAMTTNQTLLLDCADAGTRWVCVGDRGRVMLSDDHGRHWRHADLPPARLLTAVHFANAQHGWSVGHDGLVLATADGGEHWFVQYRLTDNTIPLFDIVFRNSQEGIAVGAFGTYVLTNDGGDTWTEHRLAASDAHLYGVAVSASGDLVVAGETGTLLRSVDSGATWQTLAMPFEATLFGVIAAAPATLLGYGLQGTVVYSRDAGQSWRVMKLPTNASIQTALLQSDNEVLLASIDGRLWRADILRHRYAPLAERLGPIASLRKVASGTLQLAGTFGIKQLPVTTTPVDSP
jgi:photosystem II stability/assembly factor-like uncharacterized protein